MPSWARARWMLGHLLYSFGFMLVVVFLGQCHLQPRRADVYGYGVVTMDHGRMTKKTVCAFKDREIWTNFGKPNFVFSNILIPLVVLIIYFVSFAYLLSSIWLLPSGVNYVFASRSWKYLLFLLGGTSLICLLFLKPDKIKGTVLELKSPVMKLSSGDLLLLLLPVTPVVQYIINNHEILSLPESLYTLFVFLFISSLYIFAIPVLFRFVNSARIWMFLGLAFVYTLASMALLSRNFHWYEEGSLKIQWMFFIGVFVITWILFNLRDKRILRLFIVVIFLVNSTSQLLSQYAERESTVSFHVENDNLLFHHIDGKIPKATPSIYLLVYDAYVTNETMLAYSIDNSSQEEYLKNVGFVLYPHTYSVDASTIRTMSRVLNASADFYGNEHRGVSGDGVVQNILSSLGYKNYGIFPYNYFFRGYASTYDFSFPQSNSPSVPLVSGILMGEFRFDLGLDEVSREQFIETKQSVFEDVAGNPVSIYMHSSFPGHSQNSGACLPDEIQKYAERLTLANTEMRQDIKTIMENDPTAIIIVAGDHGPYLTKNCKSTEEYDISEISRLDIQDRYGTFLAIKWPTGDFDKYDDITVLQDLFPVVFAYLYQDVSILELKVEPLTLDSDVISGATVQSGIIHGGIDDGEPVFVMEH